MPSGDYCGCGCGVTPTNYRKKFQQAFPNGYPFISAGIYYCGICQASMSWCSELHIDHIVPKKIGGDNCIHNLRPLCNHCNTQKKDTYSREDKQLTLAGDKTAKREKAKYIHTKKY